MSNLREAAEKLSAEDRAEVLSRLRDAAYHMASCWDALREAEVALEGAIETEHISGLTSSIDDPGEAYDHKSITDEILLETLESIELEEV